EFPDLLEGPIPPRVVVDQSSRNRNSKVLRRRAPGFFLKQALGGRRFPVPPAAAQAPVPGAAAAPEQTPPLVEWLSAILYRFAYTRPFRPPLPETDRLVLPAPGGPED